MKNDLTLPVLFMFGYSGAVIATPLVLAMGLGLAGTTVLLLCVIAGPTASVLALQRKIRVMPLVAIPLAALIGGLAVWVVGLVFIPDEEWCGYYPLGNPLFFIILVGSYIGYQLGATIALVGCILDGRSKKAAGIPGYLYSFAVPVCVFPIVVASAGPAVLFIPGVLADLGFSPC